MVINNTVLAALRTTFRNDFQRGLESVPKLRERVSTMVPSTTALNTYGWLEGMPGMREWIGERLIHNLKERAYQLSNKTWESTVGVRREDIEDDNLGIYGPTMQMLGAEAGEHPELLVWDLLLAGFAATKGLAWDGQYFFDSDHLTWDANGAETTFSNTGGGSGAAWFLADLSKPLKPVIFQERRKLAFTAKDRMEDDNVFERSEYQYGCDARYNAGFGLFQTIYGSKDTLSEANVVAGRTALMGQRKPSGAKLNLNPNTIICGPSNLAAALKIADAQLVASGNAGVSNVWAGRFQVLEVPYLT
jgi:phage major head subunit gpT-like protein